MQNYLIYPTLKKISIFRDIFNVTGIIIQKFINFGFWLFIGALICICMGIFYYNNLPWTIDFDC